MNIFNRKLRNLTLLNLVPSIGGMSLIILILTTAVFVDGLRYRILSRRGYLERKEKLLIIERQLDIIEGSVAFLQGHLFNVEIKEDSRVITKADECPDSLKNNLGGNDE